MTANYGNMETINDLTHVQIKNPRQSQLKIPALQRVASRVCVSCGGLADAYCARCGVTPYCSARCQRRDWAARHQAVCHNLARLASGANANDKIEAEEPLIPPTPPLRRPRSTDRSGKEPTKMDRQEDNHYDRHNEKIFTAPGAQAKQPTRSNNNYNRSGRPFNNNNNNNRDNNKKSYERRPQPKQAQEEQCWETGKNAAGTDLIPGPSGTKPVLVKTQPIAEPKPVTPVRTQPITEPKPVTPVKTQPIAEPKPVTVNGANTSFTKPIANMQKIVPAANVADVTPTKKLVPKNYVIETLPIGSVALLSVDSKTSSCATDKSGFVCLSMHEQAESDYQALCETYVVDCEADPNKFEPSPGDMFSYLSRDDGGWYRARSLGKGDAALIDSSKVVKLTASDNTKRLPAKYETMPEYCCVLDAANVKIGDNLKCTIVSKTADGYKVSLENVETGVAVGEGAVCRWQPRVELPAVTTHTTAPAAPLIPEVPRPDVANNSKVLLVHITALDKAYVRPCDVTSMREYDQLLQDVYLYAAKESPLTEPPKKGDTVIGKFTDGCFYRALCKRTNVAQDKYLLEYIDFGNVEITKLENLFPCPPEYTVNIKSTAVSLVTLANSSAAFPAAAASYADNLKDSAAELLLTIPSGAKTAPSGSAVTLTVMKSNESVNRKLQEMCTPDWKKMEDKGADVVESPKLMYRSLTYPELPANGCEIEVVEFSALKAGTLCGYEKGADTQLALEQLTARMAEYCESEIGRQPYLPAVEELCIAKCPNYEQWFRAVVASHTAGDAEAQILYIDYGNVETVPVSQLRKMLPEFVRQPALCVHLEIEDFPKDVTDEMLARAVEHMQVTDDGRGVLRATRCSQVEPGLYRVSAHALLAHMRLS